MEKVYSVTWYDDRNIVRCQMMFSERDEAMRTAKKLFEMFRKVWQDITWEKETREGVYWIQTTTGDAIIVQEHKVDAYF